MTLLFFVLVVTAVVVGLIGNISGMTMLQEVRQKNMEKANFLSLVSAGCFLYDALVLGILGMVFSSSALHGVAVFALVASCTAFYTPTFLGNSKEPS